MYGKKGDPGLHLRPLTKTSSTQILDLNVKLKTVKLLEENRRRFFINPGNRRRFLRTQNIKHKIKRNGKLNSTKI